MVWEFIDGFVKASPNGGDVRKFRQIRAIKDFGEVKRGDLGGYISGDSRMSEDAWISEDTYVMRSSDINGTTRIFGKVIIEDSKIAFNIRNMSDYEFLTIDDTVMTTDREQVIVRNGGKIVASTIGDSLLLDSLDLNECSIWAQPTPFANADMSSVKLRAKSTYMKGVSFESSGEINIDHCNINSGNEKNVIRLTGNIHITNALIEENVVIRGSLEPKKGVNINGSTQLNANTKSKCIIKGSALIDGNCTIGDCLIRDNAIISGNARIGKLLKTKGEGVNWKRYIKRYKNGFVSNIGIMGNSDIGDNVVIANSSSIRDSYIRGDSIIFGSSIKNTTLNIQNPESVDTDGSVSQTKRTIVFDSSMMNASVIGEKLEVHDCNIVNSKLDISNTQFVGTIQGSVFEGSTIKKTVGSKQLYIKDSKFAETDIDFTKSSRIVNSSLINSKIERGVSAEIASSMCIYANFNEKNNRPISGKIVLDDDLKDLNNKASELGYVRFNLKSIDKRFAMFGVDTPIIINKYQSDFLKDVFSKNSKDLINFMKDVSIKIINNNDIYIKKPLGQKS